MPRVMATMFCIGITLTIQATPAPPARPWITGWDKPVDPRGDCRFERDGDLLRITVPGKGHGLDIWHGCLDAPQLLHAVKGDFVVQVKVHGSFLPTGNHGCHRAGILLLFGNNGAVLQRGVELLDGKPCPHICGSFIKPVEGRENFYFDPTIPLDGVISLRFDRVGQGLAMKVSFDDKTWKTVLSEEKFFEVPEMVKFGVVAEATADGTLKAEFTRFKLIQLKR